MSSEEWGPWIEHDGKGCPCVGMWVRAEFTNSLGYIAQSEGRAGSDGGWSWRWGDAVENRWCLILRYRIRKPRGMKIIEELLEKLPGPERTKELETQ